MADIIDCCVRHSWDSEVEVYNYLSAAWREYMMANIPKGWHDHLIADDPVPAAALTSPMQIEASYHNPEGDYALIHDRNVEARVTNAGELARDYLQANGVGRALLCHDSGLFIPALPTPALMLELVRAVNDWTAERWLGSDPRLYGTVLVPTQVPQHAAIEIRRVARNQRMKAIILTVNGLGRPFGHPVYHPIFEAAAELGLPVVLMAGGDGPVDLVTYPTAAGLPCSYAEYRVLSPQALMTHVTSLICQGVLDRFPTLRFLVVGASIGWVIPYLWRLNSNYKAFRLDAPWLKAMPSEYFRRHFRVGTWPLRYAVSPDRLAGYLAAIPNWDELVVFASGYPDSESDSQASLQVSLPRGALSRVMKTNALDFFGWDVEATAKTTSQAMTSSSGPSELH